ncbi:zinc finger protein 687a [Pholidichthys leucotaenia]
MGDMKTPDFDDLLAAFDIPDIDAKEAIQSSPEEEQVPTDKDECGSPSSFPGSSSSQGDPPVVSVIVKNTVQLDSFEEEEEEEEEEEKEKKKSVGDETDNSSGSALISQEHMKLDETPLQLSPKLLAEAASEPQIPNGLKESPLSPQGQPGTESWPRTSPLRSTLNDDEGESKKGAEPRSVQASTEITNGLRPLFYPKSLPADGHTSSSPRSPPPVSPHLSPSTEENKFGPRDDPLSSPLRQSDSTETGIRHAMHTDEDDSEPELVIQESSESEMSSPLPFKHRKKLHSDLLESPKPHSSRSHPPNLSSFMALAKPKDKDDAQSTTPRSAPSASQAESTHDNRPSVNTSSTLVQEEKYPEHVIDERDSPESPPPSETGLLATNRSSSPDLSSALVVTHEEKLLQNYIQEDKSGETEEQSENMAEAGENGSAENSDVPFEDVGNAAEAISSSLQPLRVKIKMPSGNTTRTASSGAPKKGGRTIVKGSDGAVPSSQRHNTRSKKELLQQPDLTTSIMVQGSTSAAREDPLTVKVKNSIENRRKVSLTAVSITKTTALPSVSSSRASLGPINLHGLGQKTLNSGISLPAPLPLRPSQTNSRPASIVNSTGAIISKSQTNLVDAFNKILNNKNLLPSYKPNLSPCLPAEWGISLPAQGYCCLECGDAFALEKSLAQHYDRRSLRIEVTCNHCAKRLAFFNKCSLLLHAREHKERGLIMQCSHLVMKPVPMELMISQQEPSSAASSSFLSQSTPKPAPQTHQSVHNKEEQCMSNQCPECHTQFGSKEEVAEHFQEIKAADSCSCTECSPPMLLANSCSAAAHQRIHQGRTPYVCPECGGTAAKQTHFQIHLNESCLHFSRRIGYRCSSCLVVFGGLTSVKSHIQQAHCDTFHKCPSCPMAFKSAPSTKSHITAQHPTVTEGQPMLIYKCVMCDTVFTHKPLLYAHFDTHLSNQKVHVFKCPECTKLFSQRNSLLGHFKTHKTPTPKEETPSATNISSCSQPSTKVDSSDGDEWMAREEEKVKKEKMKAPSGWLCSCCHTRYVEQEDYITHMTQQHGKTLKKFPCNKCDSSFTTTSSMRRHIRDKHKAVTRGFRCQYCTENKKTFGSRAMLEKHIQLRHSMDTVNQDVVTRGGDEAGSSSEQETSVGAQKRQRAAVKLDQDEESASRMSPVKKLRSSSSSTSAPPPSSLPESGFRCAPCGFSSEDRAMFLEHISQHRRTGKEGGGLQCQQCGACFASPSSLSRHRFITHKVRDPLTDSQQTLNAQAVPSQGNSRHYNDQGSVNGSEAVSPSTVEGKEEDGTLTCRVCGKHFEKATDLNTHFRTHGMAFINARNAGKNTQGDK